MGFSSGRPSALPCPVLLSHTLSVSSSQQPALNPFCRESRPFCSAFFRDGKDGAPRFPSSRPPRGPEEAGKGDRGWLGLKTGWEEVSVTLIKGSSSVSIESVQKSAEQVEGGGREGAAGHEVERNDGEDNPGITLGWTGADRVGSGTLPEPPSPPVRPQAAGSTHR